MANQTRGQCPTRKRLSEFNSFPTQLNSSQALGTFKLTVSNLLYTTQRGLHHHVSKFAVFLNLGVKISTWEELVYWGFDVPSFRDLCLIQIEVSV